MRGVHLSDLEFFGFHGWHTEEGIAGAKFIVNVDVFFPNDLVIEHLDETINYVAIFELLKSNMSQPVKLLETLADRSCDQIRSLDKRISSINIKITKLNPPILNFIGTVSVSLSKSY